MRLNLDMVETGLTTQGLDFRNGVSRPEGTEPVGVDHFRAGQKSRAEEGQKKTQNTPLQVID